ncbi:MAG TPA: GerMN domain-containing protein [candidate division Zixibacteria bacterium]|nr:GerMN domain-containing protein [candidate division Zixibacteria bacterium]
MISKQLQAAILTLALVILLMGLYGVHLKRQAERLQNTQQVHAIAPPVTGPSGELTLWVPYDSDGTLHEQQVEATLPQDPGQRGQQAIHALLATLEARNSPHPIAAGDVRAVYLLNENSAVVDLNAQLADQHRSGIQPEQLTVFSMVQTMSSAAPKVTRVRFLVDGHDRETLAGHIDLKSWYDVASVAAASRQLAQH